MGAAFRKTGKRRTKEHKIADVGVNHVEYHVLHAGYTVERFFYDYGYDLNIYTFNNKGHPENGNLFVQVKSSENLAYSADKHYLPCKLRVKDILHWIREPFPVILILFDAKTEKAYYLHLQAYFEAQEELKIFSQVTLNLKVPIDNVLNSSVIIKLALEKNRTLEKMTEK